MTPEQLIDALGLEPHIEGGYYKVTYEARHSLTAHGGKPRLAMTCIFYMLTQDSPIGHWHRNRSDILHFFHSGAPLTYWVIEPNGVLKRHVLGPDPLQGHQLQLLVPGGCWKATELEGSGYGLLGEAVTPGFDYEDMQIAGPEDIKPLVPASEWQNLKRFVKQA